MVTVRRTEVVVIRDAAVKQKLGDWGAKPAATAAVVFLLVTDSDQVSLTKAGWPNGSR